MRRDLVTERFSSGKDSFLEDSTGEEGERVKFRQRRTRHIPEGWIGRSIRKDYSTGTGGQESEEEGKER